MTQYALALKQDVDPSVVRAQRTFWAAIEFAATVAGKDPKELYIELEIDKGQWSRIRSGQAHFPHEKIVELCAYLGNDIPIEWLAYKRGKGLHLLETEAERQIREKDDEIAELRKRVAWAEDMVQGRARVAS